MHNFRNGSALSFAGILSRNAVVRLAANPHIRVIREPGELHSNPLLTCVVSYSEFHDLLLMGESLSYYPLPPANPNIIKGISVKQVQSFCMQVFDPVFFLVYLQGMLPGFTLPRVFSTLCGVRYSSLIY
jgi:hypothetical protein